MSTSFRQQPPRKSRPESLKESPGSATLSPDRMLHKSDESWDHSSPLPPARQSLYRTPDKHVFHGSTISQKARDAAIDAAPMGDSCAITFADNNLGTVEMAHVISRATSGGTVKDLERAWGLKEKLNLDNRHNLLPLSADMHTAYDRDHWALLPTIETLKRIREYMNKGTPPQNYEEVFKTGVYTYDFVPFSTGDIWEGHPIIQRNLDTGSATATQRSHAKKSFSEAFKEPMMYPFNNLSIESHVHPFFVVVNAGQKLEELTHREVAWMNIIPAKFQKAALMVSEFYFQWTTAIDDPMASPTAVGTSLDGDDSAPPAAAPESPSPSTRSYNLRDRCAQSVASSTARTGNDAKKSSNGSKKKRLAGEQDAHPALRNESGEARSAKGSLKASRSKSAKGSSTKGKATGPGAPSIASSSRTGKSVQTPSASGVPLKKRPKLDKDDETTEKSLESASVFNASSRAPSATGVSESTRGYASSDYKGKKRKDRGSSEEPPSQEESRASGLELS